MADAPGLLPLRPSSRPGTAISVADAATEGHHLVHSAIYTQDDLRNLLGAITPTRAAGLSSSTLRALILLLYGAGFRISEALQLTDTNVDLKNRLIYVRCSKFFKTRLVPIGPCLARELTAYECSRPANDNSNGRFFRTKRGAPVSCCAADRIFRTLRCGGCKANRRLSLSASVT